MTRVGLIDSGVAARHASRVQAARTFWLEDHQVSFQEGVAVDVLGHGSALADVLLADPRTSLVVARVFLDRLVTTAAQVAAAFDWMTIQRVPLINVSVGLLEDREVLREAVDRSVSVSTTIVAATPARGGPVYPAEYQGVLRATGDARCAPGEISWLGTKQADFGAHVRSGDVQGASVGCAHVTARIASLMADGNRPMRAMLSLRDGAPHQGPERRGA